MLYKLFDMTFDLWLPCIGFILYILTSFWVIINHVQKKLTWSWQDIKKYLLGKFSIGWKIHLQPEINSSVIGNKWREMLCTEWECYLQESDLDSFRDIVVLEMIGVGLLLGMAIRFLSLGDRENCVAFYGSKKLRKRRPFGGKDLTCCLNNQGEMEAGVWERWHNYVLLNQKVNPLSEY